MEMHGKEAKGVSAALMTSFKASNAQALSSNHFVTRKDAPADGSPGNEIYVKQDGASSLILEGVFSW